MKKKFLAIGMLVSFTFCACEAEVDDQAVNGVESETVEAVGNINSTVESTDGDDSASAATVETEETYEIVASDMVEIRLGQTWDEALPNLAGYEEICETQYVGETTEGDTTYKWYSHTYENFTIYTSNLYYDIDNRDFDTYIVAQVVTKEAQIDLGIDVYVNDTKDTMISKLGNDYEETDVVTYTLEGSVVSIALKDDKIAEISAVYSK